MKTLAWFIRHPWQATVSWRGRGWRERISILTVFAQTSQGTPLNVLLESVGNLSITALAERCMSHIPEKSSAQNHELY